MGGVIWRWVLQTHARALASSHFRCFIVICAIMHECKRACANVRCVRIYCWSAYSVRFNKPRAACECVCMCHAEPNGQIKPTHACTHARNGNIILKCCRRVRACVVVLGVVVVCFILTINSYRNHVRLHGDDDGKGHYEYAACVCVC